MTVTSQVESRQLPFQSSHFVLNISFSKSKMSVPARKTVELFFDVVSPYTWIGFEVLCRYQQKWNIDLQLKPFFLGGIMKGAENRPPAMVPNKGTYMVKDLARLGKHFHLPINQPANPAEVMFIKGTLSAMRFLTAVHMADPEHTEAVSRELWMRVWSRDEDISEPESFAEAAKKAGVSEAVISDSLQKMKEPAAKDQLKANTEQALKYGAFGAPTIVAHVNNKPEMIFGSDRFHVLADILGEKYEGPLTELNKAKL